MSGGLRKLALLDFAGIALAVVFGAAVTYAGGINFLVLMLVFLALSVGVTKYGYSQKREIGLYEHERSWENVLANGIVPALSALAAPNIGIGAYIGSVAAITADKFASELGVLSSEPLALFSLKKVRRGTSGAVSVFGTFMSFDGALVVGLVAAALYPNISLWGALQIALIGFAGSTADTIAGVFEERGIGSKATTNLICSIVGAALGALFIK
jgi:uncharacterized protein (TIGR00297 family)